MVSLKPTLMIVVPRLLNRFYELIKKMISESTGYNRFVLDWGVQKKISNIQANGQYTHTVYDKLAFYKFKEILGGRVRFMLTASAPISPEVLVIKLFIINM